MLPTWRDAWSRCVLERRSAHVERDSSPLQEGRFNLKALVERWLNAKLDKGRALASPAQPALAPPDRARGLAGAQLTHWGLPHLSRDQINYAAADAYACLRVFDAIARHEIAKVHMLRDALARLACLRANALSAGWPSRLPTHPRIAQSTATTWEGVLQHHRAVIGSYEDDSASFASCSQNSVRCSLADGPRVNATRPRAGGRRVLTRLPNRPEQAQPPALEPQGGAVQRVSWPGVRPRNRWGAR